MKRYMAFAFGGYDANGGMDDLKLRTDDFLEAMEAARMHQKWGYGHVLDLHTGTIHDIDGDVEYLKDW